MAGTVSCTPARRCSHRLAVMLALCLAGLLVWALLIAAIADIQATLAPGDPVQTMADLRAHLLHDPAWSLHRTVRIRGVTVL